MLGICVFALSGIVWKFILVRMAAENDSLKQEVSSIRTRYDQLMAEQLSDYREVVQSYAEIAAKGRATIGSATEVMTLVLEQIKHSDKDGEDNG